MLNCNSCLRLWPPGGKVLYAIEGMRLKLGDKTYLKLQRRIIKIIMEVKVNQTALDEIKLSEAFLDL